MTLSLKEQFQQKSLTLDEEISALEQANSLEKMLIAAWLIAVRLTVILVETLLEHRAEEATQWPLCKKCGERLHSKGFEDRQMNTMFGIIHWRRRVGRCPNKCVIGQVAPLDEVLQIAPYQQSCWGLQRLACTLAVFVPFEVASYLLQQSLCLLVHPTTLWNWVQSAGGCAMNQLQQELVAFQEGQTPQEDTLSEAEKLLPLLMGADGVMVPFRPEPGTPKGKTQWREVKIGIFARLQRGVSATGSAISRLCHRRVVAVLGNTEALAKRLDLEAFRQQAFQAPALIWISDGARGLWNVYSTWFASKAIGILDFYHAAQNLWKAAAAQFDGRTTQARQWFETMRHALRHGQQAAVLAQLETALTSNQLGQQTLQTVRNVRDYLKTHENHLDYERFKVLGFPLGSGFVESTCKWLIQQRFKGVGMRWSESGFNHLLHLRLAWVNNRFDSAFPTPSPNL